jgi:hypothetical protein
MASRLTTILSWNQEIAGSTPAVVIFGLYLLYLEKANDYHFFSSMEYVVAS